MPDNNTELFYFSQYQCFYYSTSSNPWEAVYINCMDESNRQVGRIIFTEAGATIPLGHVNRVEEPVGVVIYYPLQRFNDVMNLLRYSVNDNPPAGNGTADREITPEEQSLFFSVNQHMNTWAICNNLYTAVGAQYNT